MKIITALTETHAFLLIFTIGLCFAPEYGPSHAGNTPIGGGEIRVQIDPETEQLDEVSEPVGDISEEPVGAPTEPLDEVSETDDRASEEVGADIAPTEPLEEVSRSDDQVSEEVGADSETAEQASEVLPGGPEGEEYPLEEESPPQEEMPLGDREAEGRGIGE